jgi:predicted DCC family thiol-disulfide oxidoreductase YuxK
MKPVGESEPVGPVILFDGVCHLCSSAVRFVAARDSKKLFRFAPLQSEGAGRLLDGRRGAADLSTFILVEDGRVHTRSEAALRVMRRLPGAWRLSGILRLIPRFLRDVCYDWIARNRYGWFGKEESCMVPSAELKERFLY